MRCTTISSLSSSFLHTDIMTTNNKKRDILHVVNIYFVIPYFIDGQFDYFEGKGYRMHVVCSPSPYLDGYAKAHGFDYREIPILRSVNIGQDVRSIRAICKYIKEKNIGIVVGHTPKGALLAMIAAWLCHVPVRIYFRHGLVYQTSHGLKRFILKSVDRVASLLSTKIICVSPSVLKQSVADRLAPKRKQMILANGTCCGIDTNGKFNPANIDKAKLAAMKEKWGIGNADWVIGYTGRLVRDKGIIELVEAFKKIKTATNNAHIKLLLVGMFEERDALPKDVHDEIVNNPDIVWTDFQNSDMEYFYSMMNVYVLTSYREGFPTGVLEAQAMEVPVVTTRATGCIDSIHEGETGLFTGHDASQIAKAITDIYEGKTGINGVKARQWVDEKFENHIVWKEIEKLYL